MTGNRFRQLLKPWMLPLAMLTGLLLHDYIEYVAFLTPYLIFSMLLLTFCKIDYSEVRPGRMALLLLTFQMAVSIGAYFAIAPFDHVIAQGVFICIFCPTATAAPVITAMLGGSIGRLVSYSLIINAAVAVTAPVLFSMMSDTDVSLWAETLSISRHVVPLILSPLLVALLLRHTLPKAHNILANKQSVSFYLWAVSLIIVVGRAVSFMLNEPASEIPRMVLLGVVSLAACVLQFVVGRIIGRHTGDAVAGTQALGQKNTVLAIWMALTYLNPISSIAPAAYVAWQNTINSAQLYIKAKKNSRNKLSL